MKKLLFSIFAAALASGVASAATAYTTPVGYVSLGNTAASPAVASNTDVVVSVPLFNPTEYAGEAASVGVGTLTVSGTPAWTVNQWTTVPYYFVVKTGPQAGLSALITANTADTLTLSVLEGNLSGVAATDDVAISKAWTAKTFIPPSSVPAGTQILAFAGTTPGINVAASQILTSTGTAWVFTFGGAGSADGFLVYPNESFIVRSGPTAITSLVVTGEVATSPNRYTLTKLTAPGTQQDIRLSYLNPASEGILESGIGTTAGDQLLSFNNAATGRNKAANEILTYTGTSWVGTFGIAGAQNTYPLQGGKGYVLRRASTAAAGNIDWINVQNFMPLP